MTENPNTMVRSESWFRYVVLGLGLFMGLTLALPLVVLGMPDTVKIPMLEEHDEGSAVFSHWTHNQFRCYSCHFEIFPQKEVGWTHKEMESKGQYCGACHNGKDAWKVNDDSIDCETCHVNSK